MSASRVDVLELINALRSDFKQAWKSSSTPRIESFLEQAPEQARELLFEHLLQIELRARRRQGESPRSTDYRKRFPQYRSQIAAVFDESTVLSSVAGNDRSESQELPTQTFTGPASQKLGEQLGDYRLIRELGRGAFGVVFEAEHTSRQDRLALKLLPGSWDGREAVAERLHRFRREFRSLADVNHPNLVGMQSLEVDGEHWFLTMDLVEGQDFLSYVGKGERLNEERLRRSLPQLVKGLLALHDRHIVHRDLKPSNVLVDAAGHLVILDFGLVADLPRVPDATVSRSQMFAGTPRYAAPEQLFGERSEASDWYALGTMLYEAIRGEPPFVGSQMELMRRKQNEAASRLMDWSELPVSLSDLGQLADELLRAEPGQRPASAAIVTALRLDQESTGQSSGATAGDVATAADISEGALGAGSEAIRLFGREDQLDQLRRAQQAIADDPVTRIVWVTGESGEGKSALIAAFLSSLSRQDRWLTLSGRCYDRESVPFKAIDCLIDPLVRHLRGLGERNVDQRLPQDIEVLACLFPLLYRVPAIARRKRFVPSEIDEGQVRKRASYAFAELLMELSVGEPVILSIDDLQWGDTDSAEMLQFIINLPEAPPVLLIGGYRIGERDQSLFLKRWEEMSSSSPRQWETTEIALGPLSRDESKAMLQAKLTNVGEQATERFEELYKITGGNPHLLEQLIADLNVRGSDAELRTLEELIDSRLARLPPLSRRLLQVISVAGKPLASREAMSLIGETHGGLQLLTRMRSERLVRLVGSADDLSVDTYHDRIREATLARLSPGDRKAWHLKIAETIEALEGFDSETLLAETDELDPASDGQVSLNGARLAELAFHFTSAGDSRAFAYNLLAGEQAARAHSLEAARGHFQCTLEQSPIGLSDRLRYRISIGKAQVALRQRDYAEAQSALEQASHAAATDRELLLVHVTKCELDHLNGNREQALAEIAMARRCYQRAFGETTTRRIVRFVRSTFGKWLVSSRRAKLRFLDDAACTLENRLLRLELTLLVDDPQLSSWSFLQMCLRSIWKTYQLEDVDSTTSASGIEAWIVDAHLRQLALRSLRQDYLSHAVYARLCLQLDSIPSSLLSPNSHYFAGYAHSTEGQFARGAESLQLGLTKAMRSSSTYEIIDGHHQLALQAWHLSSVTDEYGQAQEVLTLSNQVGGRWVEIWGSYDLVRALARAGDLSEAHHWLCRARSLMGEGESLLFRCKLLLKQAFFYLQASEYQRAQASAGSSWRLAKSRGMDNVFTTPGFVTLVSGCVGPEYLSKPLSTHGQLSRLTRQCRRAFSKYPNERVGIDRVHARALCALGRKTQALPLIQRAAANAQEMGLGFERARVLLDYAAILGEGEQSRSLRREGIERLRELESVIPRAESWLLDEDYDESLVAPEFDLEAWEREHGELPDIGEPG